MANDNVTTQIEEVLARAAVDDDFRLFGPQAPLHLPGVGNVEGRSGKCPDIVASVLGRTHEGLTQQAGRTGDQDPQEQTFSQFPRKSLRLPALAANRFGYRGTG